MAAFAVKEFLDTVGLRLPARALDYIVDTGFFQEHAPALLEQVTQLGIPVDDIIQRVGNNIVWELPDGTTQVLSVLEQVSGRLGGVEAQIASVAETQAALGASIAGVAKISMVTLGFSALTAGIATAQFMYLRRRLKVLQQEIKKLEVKVESQTESELEASIDFLKQANDSQGDRRDRYYHDSLVSSRNVRGYFRNLVNNRAITNDDVRVKQYYARKYFLSLGIELGCLIGLNEPDQFRKRLDEDQSTLQAIAAMFYGDILADKFERYLSPHLSDVCTLEEIAGLANTAAHLGCTEDRSRVTPSRLFEQRRASIGSNVVDRFRMGIGAFKRKSVEELQILSGIFEETQRLLSWRDTITYFESQCTTVTEVVQRVLATKRGLEEKSDKIALFSYSVAGT